MNWLNQPFELAFSYLIRLTTTRISYVSRFTHQHWFRYPWIRPIEYTVATNGVRCVENINSRTVDHRVKIGFVGRICKEKDPILFCNIAKTALKYDLNYSFDMFGDGPDLRMVLDEFGQYVTYHGWQEPSMIFANIDILIITSPIENSPFAALEAKNYGVPVIAPLNCGGIGEIIEGGSDGMLVSDRQVDSFINAIEVVVQNYPHFTEMALKRRKNYDVDISCSRIWKFMN